jgi:transcriptional regulator with XRE-family HTH domain
VSTLDITARFGLRLRQLREKQGWTQVVMAEKVGIDRSYISDMERRRVRMSFSARLLRWM